MSIFYVIKRIGLSDVTSLGLDSTNVSVEEVPLLTNSEIFQEENRSQMAQCSDLKNIKVSDHKFVNVVSYAD